MGSLEDADYYGDRANMERTLSLSSRDKRAAAAHAAMAQRYERLAARCRNGGRLLRVVPNEAEAAR
jgi:hypothetical protein